ncbi:MAG: hypothetical protein ACRDO4_10135 [Nocardioides sp.]
MMEPLVRAEHSGAVDLQMENELLRYEVVHLRARLAAAEDLAAKRQGRLERLGDQRATTGSTRDEARDDLVWLLTRLDRSPAGLLLRRYAGFSTLRDRYLGAGSGG